jgi:type IV fimbrial biogenesis protein FimT
MRQPADKGMCAKRLTCHPKILGFTTIELLVAITLLGIVLSLALPSYREMVEKRQLTQGAEQIFAFMNSMQSIASRSNSPVTVSYARAANNDWCVGAILGETPCDCNELVSSEADFCSINGSANRLGNEHTGNVGIMNAVSGDGAYAYDPVRGLMADLDDAVEMTLHSPNNSYQLRLIVSNTGHAVLCSTDADHNVPGYPVCP